MMVKLLLNFGADPTLQLGLGQVGGGAPGICCARYLGSMDFFTPKEVGYVPEIGES